MNFLGGYKYVVDFLVIAVLVGLAAFGIHKYNSYQQDIGAARVQLAWDAQKLVDLTFADKQRSQFQKEKDDAIAQSVQVAQANRAAADAAIQSGRVLQSTIDTIVKRSGSDSAEANRKYTAAFAAVFQDCREQYQALGRAADGHAQDSLMFQHAP